MDCAWHQNVLLGLVANLTIPKKTFNGTSIPYLIWRPIWKLVCGPIGNWFVDLLETGLWTFWKLVCEPIGNQFVD